MACRDQADFKSRMQAFTSLRSIFVRYFSTYVINRIYKPLLRKYIESKKNSLTCAFSSSRSANTESKQHQKN